MKSLSKTLTELGIDFSFPIEIEDANGKLTYYEDRGGFWQRWERDAEGRPIYHEDSNGFWCRWDRDANGKETYFEDSDGYKEGTPRSDKTYITLDREEAVRFAETLLAAARKPTAKMLQAAQDYDDSVVEHNQ